MCSAAADLPVSDSQVDAHTIRQFVHQLRSHLTAIGPAAEYMACADVAEDVRQEMARIVAQCVAQIEGLLSDLSVVVAPERAHSGAAATVDMVELVRAALARHMEYAQSVGAWLVLDTTEVCAPVLGNPAALEQAVRNALLLVLQVARRGDRVVAQLSAVSEAPGPELALSVELQPGDQARERGDELVDLSGVALDAARIIAEEHGGSLTAAPDRPGLVLRLPAAPAPVRRAAAAVGPHVPPGHLRTVLPDPPSAT